MSSVCTVLNVGCMYDVYSVSSFYRAFICTVFRNFIANLLPSLKLKSESRLTLGEIMAVYMGKGKSIVSQFLNSTVY